MSSGECLALIGPQGIILSCSKMLLLAVEVETNKEAGSLLTSNAEELLIAGKKLVIHLWLGTYGDESLT
jgi:hypothetical protein